MFAIRPATIEEADVIGAQRRAMFFDMGHRDGLDEMVNAFLPWVRAKMGAGEYLGWFAVDENGAIVAGAGLWLMDWPPHVIGKGGRRGNILGVYTERSYRRQGLARRLTETALEWCRANGIGVVILHASEEGRQIYRSLGFTQSNEMRLVVG